MSEKELGEEPAGQAFSAKGVGHPLAANEGFQFPMGLERVIIGCVILPHVRRNLDNLHASAVSAFQVGELIAQAEAHFPRGMETVALRVLADFARFVHLTDPIDAGLLQAHLSATVLVVCFASDLKQLLDREGLPATSLINSQKLSGKCKQICLVA